MPVGQGLFDVRFLSLPVAVCEATSCMPFYLLNLLGDKQIRGRGEKKSPGSRPALLRHFLESPKDHVLSLACHFGFSGSSGKIKLNVPSENSDLLQRSAPKVCFARAVSDVLTSCLHEHSSFLRSPDYLYFFYFM